MVMRRYYYKKKYMYANIVDGGCGLKLKPIQKEASSQNGNLIFIH